MISLIQSGDGNEWVWPYWWYYYKKYWIGDIKTIFATEVKPINYEGITHIATGTGVWSKRMLSLLEKIEDEYVLFWHEKNFVVEMVNFECLQEIEKAMIEYNIPAVKVCGKDAGWHGTTNRMPKSKIWVYDRYLNHYPINLDYIVSHQPTIWNKEFLKSTIMPNENKCGIHECQGTIRLRQQGIGVYAYVSDEDWPKCQPIPYVESVRAGKIWKGFEKYFEIKEINNA